MGFRVQRKASPRVTSHPPKVPYTLQTFTFFESRGQIFSSSGASLAPIHPFQSPWCLPGCPNGSILPPWCLPGASQAVQLILCCLPGASQAVQLIVSCLPGASLVPLKLSKLSFPVSLAPLCQRQSCAPSDILKARLCYGQPTVEPTPGFAANQADRQ